MDYAKLKEELFKVNTLFYDKVYKDPWFSKIFRNIPQDIITKQQTDFMLGAFGGPKIYGGRSPQDAHPHIFVDEDMWQTREKYLIEAMNEAQFPKDLAEKWLKIDNAFKKSIIKTDLSECKKRYNMDEIIYEPRSAFKKTGS